MIVYHGSDTVVEHPDVNHSFRDLDFGRGFYVTTVKEQAEKWAKRKAAFSKTDSPAILNVYELKEDMGGFKFKDFDGDLDTWIDFVCKCRDGNQDYRQFDLIKGKVADDKVFRVVDFYHSGIWDKARAIKEIRVYPTYDQIAFITQNSIDQLLSFKRYEEVE
ncbi:DUF3990 domain-containing protein [Lactobacillus sp.]|uniref:DUF3990 domain-containing protein n=1 Tax=Lactobacillus sp. TaxID=1591 RepID=UPI003EF7B394